jgi:hypothetical protein
MFIDILINAKGVSIFSKWLYFLALIFLYRPDLKNVDSLKLYKI